MKKPTDRPFVESFAEKAGLFKHKKDKGTRICYLSGAVTNDPYAKLKFDLAEIYLKARGHIVINPVKVNPIGTPWDDAILTDLGIISHLKDAYVALLRLSRFTDEDTYLPVIVDIDPKDRTFDSPGKRLEKGLTFNVVPIVELSSEWSKLLNDAIMEVTNAEKS